MMETRALDIDAPPPERRCQGGFSLIELMIALTVLLIGITGVLSMQVTALHATSFSRHATEASVLAEDKMEELRTMPVAAITNSSEIIDAQGNPTSDGLFTRSWNLSGSGEVVGVNVTVSWLEHGDEPHAIVLRTMRQQ